MNPLGDDYKMEVTYAHLCCQHFLHGLFQFGVNQQPNAARVADFYPIPPPS